MQQLDETVREMKPRGEVRNINVQDRRGHSLVWHAAYNGRVDAIRALANLRANVNTPNNNGATPVFVAAQNGHVDAIRALADLRANVNTPHIDGYTPMYAAAQNGHVDAIRALAQLGANVNTPDNDGISPHRAAIHNGHHEAAALLQTLSQINTPLALNLIDGREPVTPNTLRSLGNTAANIHDVILALKAISFGLAQGNLKANDHRTQEALNYVLMSARNAIQDNRPENMAEQLQLLSELAGQCAEHGLLSIEQFKNIRAHNLHADGISELRQ
ncbi:MAG: ankyrin repeat domain-containing protein, partial [Gammaproteobacteria bacterium]